MLVATSCTGDPTLAFAPGEQIFTVPASAVHCAAAFGMRAMLTKNASALNRNAERLRLEERKKAVMKDIERHSSTQYLKCISNSVHIVKGSADAHADE